MSTILPIALQMYTVRDDAALLNPALGVFRLRYGYALVPLLGYHLVHE